MEKYAWTARVRPGMAAEYERRHRDIWQEIKDALRAAGVRNYSIWRSGDVLFGYYECEKGAAFACRAQAESEVVARWERHMADVLDMTPDPETGAQPRLKQVFDLP